MLHYYHVDPHSADPTLRIRALSFKYMVAIRGPPHRQVNWTILRSTICVMEMQPPWPLEHTPQKGHSQGHSRIEA
jgi:hypothetical protein